MSDFAKIRARAAQRKGGEAVLKFVARGLHPTMPPLANITDDRILSTMAERIFSAGFVWSVIEQKWPGFEEAFLGFEPKRLLFQPDDFWYGLASDKRIVRNPPEDQVRAGKCRLCGTDVRRSMAVSENSSAAGRRTIRSD